MTSLQFLFLAFPLAKELADKGILFKDAAAWYRCDTNIKDNNLVIQQKNYFVDFGSVFAGVFWGNPTGLVIAAP